MTRHDPPAGVQPDSNGRPPRGAVDPRAFGSKWKDEIPHQPTPRVELAGLLYRAARKKIKPSAFRATLALRECEADWRVHELARGIRRELGAPFEFLYEDVVDLTGRTREKIRQTASELRGVMLFEGTEREARFLDPFEVFEASECAELRRLVELDRFLWKTGPIPRAFYRFLARSPEAVGLVFLALVLRCITLDDGRIRGFGSISMRWLCEWTGLRESTVVRALRWLRGKRAFAKGGVPDVALDRFEVWLDPAWDPCGERKSLANANRSLPVDVAESRESFPVGVAAPPESLPVGVVAPYCTERVTESAETQKRRGASPPAPPAGVSPERASKKEARKDARWWVIADEDFKTAEGGRRIVEEAQRRGEIEASEAGTEFGFACVARARDNGDDAARLFRWLLRRENHKNVSNENYDAGRRMRRELLNVDPPPKSAPAIERAGLSANALRYRDLRKKLSARDLLELDAAALGWTEDEYEQARADERADREAGFDRHLVPVGAIAVNVAQRAVSTPEVIANVAQPARPLLPPTAGEAEREFKPRTIAEAIEWVKRQQIARGARPPEATEFATTPPAVAEPIAEPVPRPARRRRARIVAHRWRASRPNKNRPLQSHQAARKRTKPIRPPRRVVIASPGGSWRGSPAAGAGVRIDFKRLSGGAIVRRGRIYTLGEFAALEARARVAHGCRVVDPAAAEALHGLVHAFASGFGGGRAVHTPREFGELEAELRARMTLDLDEPPPLPRILVPEPLRVAESA